MGSGCQNLAPQDSTSTYSAAVGRNYKIGIGPILFFFFVAAANEDVSVRSL